MSCMKLIKSILSGATILSLATLVANAADNRSYVAGHFSLEVDGVKSGAPKSFSGGDLSADVINEPLANGLLVKKHIGMPKYEEVSLQLGFSMGKPIYDWISDTLDQKYSRKSGSLVAADFNNKEKQRMNFQNALISEITFPACDGSSKDAGYLTVKFSPEIVKWLPGDGKSSVGGAVNTKQKPWIPSNFQLAIPGLDCSHVSKIEAFTIKQKRTERSIGETRNYELEPTSLEIPNLTVTLPAVQAGTWIDWSENFIAKGNNGDESEKTGTLSFISQDRKEELARIQLFGVGIRRLQRSASGNSDAVATITAELYVERMEVDFMAQFDK